VQELDKGKALVDWRFTPQFTCCTSTKVQILTLDELLLQDLDKRKALLEGCVLRLLALLDLLVQNYKY
jgi:hypothetical protein